MIKRLLNLFFGDELSSLQVDIEQLKAELHHVRSMAHLQKQENITYIVDLISKVVTLDKRQDKFDSRLNRVEEQIATGEYAKQRRARTQDLLFSYLENSNPDLPDDARGIIK